ncbi:MAG: PTS transporter subunit EIIC, partial [Floccifex sp.]
MNFMEKFNEIADRTLVPVANKLANQRHLAAIRDGMVVAIPLSILGGFCLIISTPPFKPETLPNWGVISDMLMAWYNWAQLNKAALQLPYNMTMALMGLFIAFSISYNLAKRYKMAPLNASVVSTATFLLVSSPVVKAVATTAFTEGATIEEILASTAAYIPMTYLDAKGIFTAIIVSIGCVEIMNFLLKKNIRFKMPEGVPPAITASFDAIIPLFVCVFGFYAISLLVQNFSGQLLPSLIMSVLAPAVSGLDSLLGICLIV